jgi:hypothetical protein
MYPSCGGAFFTLCDVARRSRVILTLFTLMIETTETIRTVLTIQDRGVVVLPAIPFGSNVNVRVGDHGYIITPNGECLDVIIRGMELVRTTNPLGAGVLLPNGFVEADVPIGSTFHGVADSPMDGSPDHSAYEIGDDVTVRLNFRNKTFRTGTIEKKNWHHKNGLWYYYIRDLDGKPVSNRYTAACLFRVENRK